MKKLWLLSKIEIHYTTLIYLVLSILVGVFKQTLTLFFIVIIHECGHLMASYCFNFKIRKIKILPFGAFLELSDFGVHHVFEEICVVVSGPLVHIVLYAFFCWLYRLNYISFIHFEYCLTMNRTILIFNLLPIYPLDGAKLLILIGSYVFDYLMTLKIVLFVSIISLWYLIYHYFSLSYVFVFSFLILNVYFYSKEYYLIYHQLLTYRLHHCQYKIKLVHKDNKFFRPFKNYYFHNTSIKDERTFILQRFFD